MVNVQTVMYLFALLVFSTITAQEEETRSRKAFGICNFFQEAGFKCIGCHERLVCLPFNIAFTKSCGSLYCNNGFCSTTMGSMCSSNNTSSTTSSAPEETTASACTEPSSALQIETKALTTEATEE